MIRLNESEVDEIKKACTGTDGEVDLALFLGKVQEALEAKQLRVEQSTTR